ncbi:MAG: hypothetical protein K9M54_11205, partial [Kiritimatiellales bacterium]|nr:hypothetical protein [Kiritimatiellales bacterium]
MKKMQASRFKDRRSDAPVAFARAETGQRPRDEGVASTSMRPKKPLRPLGILLLAASATLLFCPLFGMEFIPYS